MSLAARGEQKHNGRDQSPHGFMMWMAGGSGKGGTACGTSEDFGIKAAENKVDVPDVHATILRLPRLDHERLSYRHAGRDFRLTDVAGHASQAVPA